MIITDYNFDTKQILAEIEDTKEASFNIVDFFDFHCEAEGWMHDENEQRVCIPAPLPYYDFERETFQTIDSRCEIISYDKFLSDPKQPIKRMLESYILSADVVLTEKEGQDIDDSDEQAYREFRAAQF